MRMSPPSSLFPYTTLFRSVCHHLASPSADGLFHQAIIQSAIECGAPAPPYAYGLPPDGGHAEPPSMHIDDRSEEHTSELQSRGHLVCRLLLEKKIAYNSRH